MLFLRMYLGAMPRKNRDRAAAYCILLRCGGDTVGFTQPVPDVLNLSASFLCAVFCEEGKMALEIRDPADSSPTTMIVSGGAHSNILSGKSLGLQIRAAFVYNLHVGEVRPSSSGWSGPSFGFTANLRKRFSSSEDVWRSWWLKS